MITPGCHRHRVAQTVGLDRLPVVGTDPGIGRAGAPGHDGTVRLQCQAVVSPGRDRHRIAQTGRHDRLPEIRAGARVGCPRAPGRGCAVGLERQAMVVAGSHLHDVAQAGRDHGLPQLRAGPRVTGAGTPGHRHPISSQGQAMVKPRCSPRHVAHPARNARLVVVVAPPGNQRPKRQERIRTGHAPVGIAGHQGIDGHLRSLCVRDDQAGSRGTADPATVHQVGARPTPMKSDRARSGNPGSKGRD